MPVKYTNNAFTTLGADITDASTTIFVVSALSFPPISGDDYTFVTLISGGYNEIVKVTNITGTTFTVERGQDNTTAQSFITGDRIELRLTSALIKNAFIAPDASTDVTGVVELSTSTENIAGVATTVPTVAGVKEMVLEHADVPEITVVRQNATATAAQTVFSLATSYTPGLNLMMVYINGVRMRNEDFTETNSTTITFSSGLSEDDEVLFESGNVLILGEGTSAGLVTFVPTGNFISTNVQDALLESDTLATTALTSTNVNVGLTNADVVATGLDKVATSSDVTLTNADVVTVAASAAAALASENAAATNLGLTNTDVGLTNADVVTAATHLASVEGLLDAFDDRYLGAKASDPTLDNDGEALTDGALVFNTTANVMKVYDLGLTTWLLLTGTLSNIVEDPSPQLGGNLDLNGYVIIGLETAPSQATLMAAGVI